MFTLTEKKELDPSKIEFVDFSKKEKLKLVLKLECLSDQHWKNRRLLKLIYRNSNKYLRQTKTGSDLYYHPWVAEIKGFSEKYNFDRLFIKGTKDYSEANSSGTKGVYMYFFLNKNKLYEACENISFLERKRVFIKTENNIITKISPEEAIEWTEKNC